MFDAFAWASQKKNVSVELRPYTPDDLSDVLSIWEAAIRQSCPFLSDDFLAEERANIAEKWMPICECWIASDEAGDTVGFVALIGNEVGGLFVHPSAQGSGHGRALVNKAQVLRGRLELNVFKKNEIGRRFYAAYGFTYQREHIQEETGEVELRLVFNPSIA